MCSATHPREAEHAEQAPRSRSSPLAATRFSCQMLLLSHGISFVNPRRKLIIEFLKTVDPKRVQMISLRKGFHAGKPRMLNPAGKNKVTNQIISPHLHRDERHAHLKRNTGLLRQDLHRPALLDHRCECIEHFTNLFALAGEV